MNLIIVCPADCDVDKFGNDIEGIFSKIFVFLMDLYKQFETNLCLAWFPSSTIFSVFLFQTFVSFYRCDPCSHLLSFFSV